MQDKEKDPYIITYLWFIKMTSDKKTPFYLTSFQRELFGCIHSLSRKRPCNASDAYLASIFKVSIKHTNQSIGILKEMRLIKVWHDGKGRKMTSALEKGGAFYYRDDTHIWIMDLNGLLMFESNQVGSLPDNFFDLPRGKIKYT